MTFSIILRISTAILLFIGICKLPYDYYTILRFMVTGTSVYEAWIAYERNTKGWTIIFAMITLLFNPVLQVHFSKSTWRILDFVTGLIMLLSIRLMREKFKNKE